ncbi:MAG: PAS domain S-box protein, partial [Inhella sp.]
MSPPIHPDPPLPLGQGNLSALLAVAPALLPALLDAIPARVVVLDPQECLTYGNPAFYAFTGLQPEVILGCPIRHVIGEQAYANYAPVRERLARGETVCWEDWIELNAVGPRYMREHLVPAFDAQGQRLGTIVISLDWTELRQNQQQLEARLDELHATQALKSSIVDQALAAIISTDAQGRIVEFNPAAEALFGRQRTEVLGQLVEDVVIPPRHRAGHRAGMARVAKGGPARMLGQRLEMDALRADGTEFPVEMVLSRNAVGDTSFYTASMFDLTERRNAQAQIERQRDALRQSEKLTAMGSLLAGVAHELNNPLAIVMGRAS